MILRDYQLACVAAIHREFEEKSSTLAVLPTGCGKTIIFSSVTKDFIDRGRVLIIAHREELISQAWQKVKDVTGHEPEIEMADRWSNENDTWFNTKAKIVVSTIQTQTSGMGGDGRMSRFKPEEFSLVIIDEAHHTPASSYKRLVDHYRKNPNLKVLGVTATPDRADELALGQVFESVAFDYEIEDAIDQGWLVPIRQKYVVCEHLDISGVKTTAGDLNSGQLAAVLEAETQLHEMVDPTIQIAGDKKVLFFANSVAQAERTAEIFNRHKPGSCRTIFGKTPKEDRRETMADFRSGKFNVLVNVGVATEGFDMPDVEVVAVGRPTKSRALYAQMIGRGTRPLGGLVDPFPTAEERKSAIAASSKPNMLVLDFVGNSGKHKLVTTADILGGRYDDDIRERAKRAVRKAGGDADMSEELKKQEVARRKEQEEAERRRRERLVAKSTFSEREIDPFGQKGYVASVPRHWYIRKATDKQKALLSKKGFDAREWTVAKASKCIDAIANAGWRVTPEIRQEFS